MLKKLEAEPSPSALVAVTLNRYSVPAVRPVALKVVDGGVPVTSVPELKAPKTPGLVAVAMYTVKEVGTPPNVLGVQEIGILVLVVGPLGPSPIGASGNSANTIGNEPTDTELNIINIINMERSFLYNTTIKKKKKYINFTLFFTKNQIR
jgi:hypothetical protein